VPSGRVLTIFVSNVPLSTASGSIVRPGVSPPRACTTQQVDRHDRDGATNAALSRRSDGCAFARFVAGRRKNRFARLFSLDVGEHGGDVCAHSAREADVPTQLLAEANAVQSKSGHAGKRSKDLLALDQHDVLPGNCLRRALKLAGVRRAVDKEKLLFGPQNTTYSSHCHPRRREQPRPDPTTRGTKSPTETRSDSDRQGWYIDWRSRDREFASPRPDQPHQIL
jgi:hypothetical protein